ncbi:hypothetical protein AGDE_16871 [Angomonas deanei]|nr:hypothetical protein AGDE_16871 [Angomonas deanei]|eukprot:EPY16013.1 hypothetical protein AGDE_16871 [Angomonas deanei]
MGQETAIQQLREAYVSGDELYLEIGVDGFYVLGRIRVLRVHLQCTDCAAEAVTNPYRYSEDHIFRTFVIVFSALFAAAALLMLFSWWCYRDKEEEEQ